jgi:hypothetical protein
MKCTEILILKIRLALPIIAPDEGKSFAVAELQQSPLPAWRNDAVGPDKRALGGGVTHKLGGAACLVVFRVAVRRRAVEKVYRSVR